MLKDRCTVTDYKICFSTESGRRVLANLLAEAGFFDILKTTEELAIENFVKIILNKTGSYPEINFDKGTVSISKKSTERIELFVSNLLNMKMEY